MRKTAVSVMLLTVLSKVSGFAREIALSYVYGASAITDAYLTSQTIPSVMFSMIAAGIAASFIPLYSRELNKHGKQNADRFMSNLINLLFLLTSLLVAFVVGFARPIVRGFASGLTAETQDLAVMLSRISIFSIYFNGLAHVLANYLRMHGNYVVPSLLPVSVNVLIIVSLFISRKTSLSVLAVGSALAAGSQVVVTSYFVRRLRYKHKLLLRPADDLMREVAVVSFPMIVGMSLNEINVLVDRSLASNISVGAISTLNYANRLVNFVHGLCVLSVTTVLFPRVAKMVAEGDVKAFKASLTEALSMVNFLVVPATVGTVVFSEEIVRFLFARGAFTEEATLQTSEALLFYSFGMLALGARDVFMRCLFALKDSKTPMTNTMAGVVVNVILSILLSRPLGVAGIALATSIASMVTALRMFVTLRRRIGPFGFRELLRSLSRVLLASILMGCVAKVSFILLRSKLMERMALSLAICAGVLAYIIFAMMFHVPEIERTMKLVKRKLVAILGRESVQTH